MNYPDKETYRALYSRYVADQGRPISQLMDHAGDLKGKLVVDLCGGAGEIAAESARRGALAVVLVDESSDMVDFNVLKKAEVSYHYGCVENFLNNHKLDVAFCRQAVTYWLTDESARDLAKMLNPGGVFVFNTFNNKPSEKPTVKEYTLGSKQYKYVEVSLLIGDVVHHVQCREGMEPHTTQFKWISPERFREMLAPYFEIEEKVDGATSIYVCYKK